MPRSTVSAKRALAAAWPAWACGALLAAVMLAVHAAKYPDFASFWAGADQQRYLESARAWAAGDLSPAHHHYLPFYPLMGAAFVWLTPWQPFLLPDLACLLASLAIFLRIARRLAPGWRPVVAAVCFVVAVLSGRSAAAVWIVPWSTTGAAPFQFLAVLLALRFAERPGWRRAGLFGLCIAGIAGFRPSDAAVVAATGSLYAAWALWRAGAGWRGWCACAAGGAAGLLAGLAVVAALHLLVFGATAGPYVSKSAGIGFEWRLLALRWVMIVIGPRPLLPEGTGLAAGLPWIVPGLAGAILALATAAQRGAAGVLVVATVALHWAVYLAYRDLQPYGLWRFYNLNYFKWTLPFLVLWAAQLLVALARRRQRLPAMAACLAAVLLLAWRPVLRRPQPFAVIQTADGLQLPGTAMRLDRASLLPLHGTWQAIYFGPFMLHAGGRSFVNTRDFKMLPVGDGALLLPLRPLPAGPAVLDLPAGVGVDTAAPAMLFRQDIVFGLPCFIGGSVRVACR